MGKLSPLLVVWIVTGVVLPAPFPVAAADPGAGAPPPISAPDEAAIGSEALDDYLRRRAVLLMIRSTFNLLLPADVPRVLAADVRRIGAAGPSEEESLQLDNDLLAEGSYYLVSLRYLAETGGAVWPSDRPESSYANDSLVELDALQDQLIEAIEQRADPLPILQEAQAILALTEGFTKTPASLDRFADRDAIIEDVLAKHGPRTKT